MKFQKLPFCEILVDARLFHSTSLVTPFTTVAHQSTPLLIRLTKLMQLCYDLLFLEFSFSCTLVLIVIDSVECFIVQIHRVFMKYEERLYMNIKVYDIKVERRINRAKSL